MLPNSSKMRNKRKMTRMDKYFKTSWLKNFMWKIRTTIELRPQITEMEINMTSK